MRIDQNNIVLVDYYKIFQAHELDELNTLKPKLKLKNIKFSNLRSSSFQTHSS